MFKTILKRTLPYPLVVIEFPTWKLASKAAQASMEHYVSQTVTVGGPIECAGSVNCGVIMICEGKSHAANGEKMNIEGDEHYIWRHLWGESSAG